MMHWSAVVPRRGKRGRGAEGKRPVLIAVERRAQNRAEYLAMEAVDHVNRESVLSFRRRLGDGCGFGRMRFQLMVS